MASSNPIPNKPNILIVDDTPDNLSVLGQMLSENGFAVRPATSGKQAIQAAQLLPPDLILLDILMPEMNGFEVCAQLKNDPNLRGIPIIFISALDEIEHKVTAFHVGGVDYVTKPFQAEEVLARVNTHLTISRQQAQIQLMAAQQLAEKERHITHLQRLSELQQEFFSTAIHDLKNPLTLLLTVKELIYEMDDIREESQHYLDLMEKAAQYMQRLIANIMDLATLESHVPLNKEMIALDWLVRGIYERHLLMERRPELHLIIPEDIKNKQISVDVLWFDRALSNVISNAVKFTPETGKVQVTVKLQDTTFTVTVRDTGIGMSKETLANIFDRFYRSPEAKKRQIQGTGLGLSIVKGAIEAHGGYVTIDSKKGEGTRTHIHMPVA